MHLGPRSCKGSCGSTWGDDRKETVKEETRQTWQEWETALPKMEALESSSSPFITIMEGSNPICQGASCFEHTPIWQSLYHTHGACTICMVGAMVHTFGNSTRYSFRHSHPYHVDDHDHWSWGLRKVTMINEMSPPANETDLSLKVHLWKFTLRRSLLQNKLW